MLLHARTFKIEDGEQKREVFTWLCFSSARGLGSSVSVMTKQILDAVFFFSSLVNAACWADFACLKSGYVYLLPCFKTIVSFKVGNNTSKPVSRTKCHCALTVTVYIGRDDFLGVRGE